MCFRITHAGCNAHGHKDHANASVVWVRDNRRGLYLVNLGIECSSAVLHYLEIYIYPAPKLPDNTSCIADIRHRVTGGHFLQQEGSFFAECTEVEY